MLEAVQVAASLPLHLQPYAPLSVRMVVHALQETCVYASLSGPGRRVRCPSVIRHVQMVVSASTEVQKATSVPAMITGLVPTVALVRHHTTLLFSCWCDLDVCL